MHCIKKVVLRIVTGFFSTSFLLGASSPRQVVRISAAALDFSRRRWERLIGWINCLL